MKSILKLSSALLIAGAALASGANAQSFSLGVSSGGFFGSVSTPVYRPVVQTQGYYAQPQAAYVQYYAQPRAQYVRTHYVQEKSYVYRPQVTYVAQPVYRQRAAYHVYREPRVETYQTVRYVNRQVVQNYVEAVPSTHTRVTGYNYRYAPAYGGGYGHAGYQY